jgi:hypothetical protein
MKTRFKPGQSAMPSVPEASAVPAPITDWAMFLLAGFYGIGGDKAVSDGALAQFMKSPDYQFALKGGSEALDNSLVAPSMEDPNNMRFA